MSIKYIELHYRELMNSFEKFMHFNINLIECYSQQMLNIFHMKDKYL